MIWMASTYAIIHGKHLCYYSWQAFMLLFMASIYVIILACAHASSDEFDHTLSPCSVFIANISNGCIANILNVFVAYISNDPIRICVIVHIVCFHKIVVRDGLPGL